MEELAGPIDGIDEDERAPAAGLLAARGGLFGDDRKARQPLGQPSENDRLGALVGVADHARVGLAAGVVIARIDTHDGHGGFDRQLSEDFRHLIAVDR